MGSVNLKDGTVLEFDDVSGEFLESVSEELRAQYFSEQAEGVEPTGATEATEEETPSTPTGPIFPDRGLKEWIMLYGQSGTGKTHSALSIMDRIYKSGSPAHFHCIDTDFAIEMNIENFPDLQDSGRVHVDQCADFGEIQAATDRIIKKVRPANGDWVVMDKISDAWALSPEWYVRSRLKMEVDDLEQHYRGSSKKGDEFRAGNALLEYYAGGITPMYRTWEQQVLYRTKCHVLVTCGEKETVAGTGRMDDSNAMIKEFGKTKPNSNRDTPFKFHTILRTEQPYEDQWMVTTKRERRKRVYWKRERIRDFGDQYLIGVARWSD